MSAFRGSSSRRGQQQRQQAPARIMATCPGCGDVDLTPWQVDLQVCSEASRSTYAFTCPRCREEIRKHAPADVVAALTIAGVPTVEWEIPSEALEEHHGPAISWDDVLDLQLALATADLAGQF